MNIPLGYEIGSGKRVSIPVNHTVVLGQTQLSGKTTTLEAMVTRSGLRAIGFITKPGEKSFRLQTQIPAFFSESTIEEYWKHVVSILEYRSGTRLGWRERGVIIKLCQDYKKESSRIGMDKKSGKSKREAVKYSWRAPKSLRDLLANIDAWMPFTRGQEEMICIQLREYLRPAISEIERTVFSDKLKLNPGINVMDVTDLSDGLKSLVIRSVIEWVHAHGRKIVVIIPEAWKFIPEGRSTPVKLALEGLIREGAGVGNFVWMDSQDLRGVDKLLLRSVIVWLFGVQRQKNEVASTLASIPDHPKPTATEIMQLGKGEFYVCYGTTLVRTYVQPAGMEDAHAQAIARGDESPDSWRQIARALDEENETTVLPEAGSGQPEDEMRISAAVSASHSDGESVRSDVHGAIEGESYVEAAATREGDSGSGHGGIRNEVREEGEDPGSEDEAVWKQKYEALEIEHKTLIEAHDGLADRLANLEQHIDRVFAEKDKGNPMADAAAFQLLGNFRHRQVEFAPSRVSHFQEPSAGETPPQERAPARGHAEAPKFEAAAGGENGAPRSSPGAPELSPGRIFGAREEIYRYVIDRATKDPRVLAVLANRPELRVTVERQTIEADGGTLRGALAVLITKKFFDSPQNANTAFNELKRLGRRVAKPGVYRELDKLAELGFVTKEDAGYQAVPGMKVHIVETGKARPERSEGAVAAR